MKLKSTFRSPVLVILAIALLALPLVPWAQKENPPAKQEQKKDRKIVDLDEAVAALEKMDLQQTLEKAMKEMAEAMKSLEINHEELKQELEKAMKEVDMEKIHKQVRESMARVDLEKVQKQLDEAMKNVDKEEIKLEVRKAMREVDMTKIQKEVEESMAKVDWEKMKKELEEVKKINTKELKVEIEKVRKEMEKMGPQLKEELSKAKAEMEKAKAELKEYKEFVDGLENDGLINKKENYTIKHENGELIVNGKKVPYRIYNKYRSFLEKHKSLDIKKNADNFNIE